MSTPTPSALPRGFVTNGTKGAVSGSGAALQSHDYVSNDTKAQIETAGYFNPVKALLKVGDTLTVTGDLDGVPWHSSYVVASVPTNGDVTLTEHSSVVQNVTHEITMNKISSKASDAEVFRFVPNFNGRISKIRTVLNNVLATADATVQAKINGTNVTNGLVTIANAGSAAGDVDEADPTAANTFTAGQVITLTVGGGSTATGTFNASLTLIPS